MTEHRVLQYERVNVEPQSIDVGIDLSASIILPTKEKSTENELSPKSAPTGQYRSRYMPCIATYRP